MAGRYLVLVVLFVLIGCIVYADFVGEHGMVSGDFVLDYSSSSFDKRTVIEFGMYANATLVEKEVVVVDPDDASLHTDYAYKVYYFEVSGRRINYIYIKHQYNTLGSSHNGMEVLKWGDAVLMRIFRPEDWYYKVVIYNFSGAVINSFTREAYTNPVRLITVFQVLDGGKLNIIFKENYQLLRNITIQIPEEYQSNFTFRIGVAIWNKYVPSYAFYRYVYVEPSAYFERLSLFMRGFEVVSVDSNITVINNFVSGELLTIHSGVWGLCLKRIEDYYVLDVWFLNGINSTYRIDVDESDLYVEGRTNGSVEYFVRLYRVVVRQYTRFSELDEIASYLFIGVLALIPLIFGSKGFVLSMIWVVGLTLLGVIPFWIGFIILFLTIIYVVYRSGVL